MSGPKHTPSVPSGPCPGCRGRGYDVDGEDDFVTCPDCAGSGLAEHSITANEKLRDAAPRLAEALNALLNELPSATTHPVIVEARAALREAGYER